MERALRRPWLAAFVLLAGVYTMSVLGLITRDYSPLAAFWPANAALAGALVVLPALVRWWTIPIAAVGFFVADLLTYDPLLTNLWLTTANLLSAGACYLVLAVLPQVDRRLGRPLSVFGIGLASLAGATVSASATCWMIGPALGITVDTAWVHFVGGEFASHLILLPVLLTLPFVSPKEPHRSTGDRIALVGGPILTLLGLAATLFVGGPGFLAYPLPGLLLTAATRPVLPTAVLSMVVAATALLTLDEGWLQLTYEGLPVDVALSAQVGMALVAMGPIAVASMLDSRNDMVRSLRWTAAVDAMTGALTRTAFMERTQDVGDPTRPSTVLLLDIDHFKSVNDGHGHAAGDAVLERVGTIIRSHIRSADLFGRLGGEEFAVLLEGSSRATGVFIAERIRTEVAGTTFGDLTRKVTVSIGVAHRPDAAEPFPELLHRADQLLYGAKEAGRNRTLSDLDPAAERPRHPAPGRRQSPPRQTRSDD